MLFLEKIIWRCHRGLKPIRQLRGPSPRFSSHRPAEDNGQRAGKAWRSCSRSPRCDLSVHLPSHISLSRESFWSLISLTPGTGGWPLGCPHPRQRLAAPHPWAPPGCPAHAAGTGQLPAAGRDGWGAQEPAQLPCYFIILELYIYI